MKVINEIKPYKINGVLQVVGNKTPLIISSCNDGYQCVEITFGNETITVDAKDLSKAIENSLNVK